MRRLLPVLLLSSLWPGVALGQEGPGQTTNLGEQGSLVERAETADSVAASESDDEDDGDWWLALYGYVRAGYDWVETDERFDFVGRTNGFVLHNARLGLQGGRGDWGLSFRLSIDGVTDLRENVNTPQGDLDVRLRDAYVREDPIEYVGVQVGQFRLPFSAEEMQSTSGLMFVSRAVGLQGVPVGRGREREGIVLGRDLGVMISPEAPIYFGGFGFAYYLAASNGNGANELLNDNNELALSARLELYWERLVRIGVSYLSNSRTEGDLPNQFDESDTGLSADLWFGWEGLELFGQLTTLDTAFDTTGAADRERLAWHAQVSYTFDQLCFHFAPAYRIAYFDDRGEAEAGTLNGDRELTYHTVGLRVWIPRSPVLANFNYTITGEVGDNVLDNDRFEALVQVEW